MILPPTQLTSRYLIGIVRSLLILSLGLVTLDALLPNHVRAQMSEPVQLTDIRAYGHSSSPQDFIEMNEKLLFTAWIDDMRSLWRSDGTHDGTVKLGDIPFFYVLWSEP